MTPLYRITFKKILHPEYSHSLHYQGQSGTPRAFAYKTAHGWVLCDTDGRKRGVYDSVVRLKMRAVESGLL